MKKQIETNAAAAETIMRRMPIMWWQMMSPTAAGEAEMTRMVEEKQKAMVDGIVAAQTQLMKETFRFWTTPFFASKSGNASQRIMDAATAPARRTVNANVKRLRKG
jgi:hypothetical protein